MSIENMRAGPPARPADAVENASIPAAATEAVLEELHHAVSTHTENGHGSDEPTLQKISQDVAHCECYALFERYASGKIPTLERMFGNLQPLLAHLASDIESERVRVAQGTSGDYLRTLMQMHGLISGREQQVRSAIQRYVYSVIRFQNLRRLSAGGARDVTRQFVDADHARRRAHDNLIESLRIYATQMQAAIDEGYGEADGLNAVFWTPDMDARESTPDKTLVFAHEVMNSREFIRDWAIVADFSEQLRILGNGQQDR